MSLPQQQNESDEQYARRDATERFEFLRSIGYTKEFVDKEQSAKRALNAEEAKVEEARAGLARLLGRLPPGATQAELTEATALESKWPDYEVRARPSRAAEPVRPAGSLAGKGGSAERDPRG